MIQQTWNEKKCLEKGEIKDVLRGLNWPDAGAGLLWAAKGYNDRHRHLRATLSTLEPCISAFKWSLSLYRLNCAANVATKNIEIPLSAICIHNNYLLCITNDSWQVDRTKQSQVFLQQNLKTPSSPQLNFPSHCHINSDPNLLFSTNLCNCLEDRTPDQPLASTETEAAPVLRTQPPASLPEKAVSSAEERRSWPPRTRQHPALSSSVHPLICSWPSINIYCSCSQHLHNCPAHQPCWPQLASPPLTCAKLSALCKSTKRRHTAQHSDPDEGKLKVAEDRSQVGKCHRRTE